MAYQMAATAVTLNNLEGHSPVEAFSDAIRRTFVQHFTRFQLTVCSHGSSALAELLVNLVFRNISASDDERNICTEVVSGATDVGCILYIGYIIDFLSCGLLHPHRALSLR